MDGYAQWVGAETVVTEAAGGPQVKILLSWSGERSKRVALAAKTLIRDVVRTSHPWMSEVDIPAGARWGAAISSELRDTKFGILCVTRDNIAAPWLMFEAGAIAKTVDDAYVCPLLVDMRPSEIPPGPLAQFQAKTGSKDDVWTIIKSINTVAGTSGDAETELSRRHDRCWPEFESAVAALPQQAGLAADKRPVDEMVEETLLLLRQLATQSEEQRDLGRRILIELSEEHRGRAERKYTEAQLGLRNRRRGLTNADLEYMRRILSITSTEQTPGESNDDGESG